MEAYGSSLPSVPWGLLSSDHQEMTVCVLCHLQWCFERLFDQINLQARLFTDLKNEMTLNAARYSSARRCINNYIKNQHDEIEAKFSEESQRAALEAKYQKLYQPFYTKRYEIVTGVVEVEEKGVPDFWLTALKNNEIIAEVIPEMKVLLSILRISNGTGTEIEWFPGKCLTRRILKNKPNKGSKNTKRITKTEDCESFFTFLSPPQVSDDEEDLDDDMVWAPPKC
ncbi:hypothetical protein F2Q68_00043130, partial [Brassica cretica]